MQWFEWLGVGAVLVLAGWELLSTPRAVASMGQSFAEQYHVWIAGPFAPAVDRAHRRVSRESGAVLGLGAVTYVVLRGWWPAEPVFWVLMYALGAVALLLRLRTAGTEFPVAEGALSLARGRAVGLRDYLPRRALISLALCPGVAICVAGLVLVLVQRGSVDTDLGWTVLCFAITLGLLGLLVPVVAVVLCRRPEPAGDASHLYLQDAWRVDHLHWMLSMETVGAFVLLNRTLDLFSASAVRPALVPLLIVALGWVWYAQSGRLHFRSRLWPDLAPDERIAVPAGASA